MSIFKLDVQRTDDAAMVRRATDAMQPPTPTPAPVAKQPASNVAPGVPPPAQPNPLAPRR